MTTTQPPTMDARAHAGRSAASRALVGAARPTVEMVCWQGQRSVMTATSMTETGAVRHASWRRGGGAGCQRAESRLVIRFVGTDSVWERRSVTTAAGHHMTGARTTAGQNAASIVRGERAGWGGIRAHQRAGMGTCRITWRGVTTAIPRAGTGARAHARWRRDGQARDRGVVRRRAVRYAETGW